MDIQYKNLVYKSREIEHLYGDNIHILANPVLQTTLAQFCSNEVALPQINQQLLELYQFLIDETLNLEFEKEVIKIDTRMKSLSEQGYFEGDVLSAKSKAVVISLARAGIIPSHVCFERLHSFLSAEGLRQDHFYINRKVNDQNEVIGVDISGSKVGGEQEGAYVLLPDPMGATGGSISYVVNHYKNQVHGKAKKYIALHLIVTPEYILRMQKEHPDLVIIALRLDRGLSSERALNTIPGTYPEEEKGLTETQYIVPGAGGVGEILNNSFV